MRPAATSPQAIDNTWLDLVYFQGPNGFAEIPENTLLFSMT